MIACSHSEIEERNNMKPQVPVGWAYARAVVLAIAVVVFVGIVGCKKDTPPQPATEGKQRATAARHVSLDGQPNFRDLGGYKTVDGRAVKWGQVYRSGELPRLSDADIARMDDLGIRTVVNFLIPMETEARGADRLPDGVREVSQPISGGAGGGLTKVVSEARRTGDFSKVPVELNGEMHRLLVRDARQQYATLLREIADASNRPLVFHCSHGVHRTGTAAAILLATLGVPWETVREDYLLSNEYRKEEVERRLTQLRQLAAENQGIEPDQVDTTNMNAFYILQGSYIDATFDEITKQYGSMDNYLRKGLGLSEAEIERLRTELLE
jgi:protein-tyrosine phosphatase